MKDGKIYGFPKTEQIRTFETGATRSSDQGRDDPEGYLSPLALDRFNQYMTKHRAQADGGLRASDNWQKGMPADTLMKGLFRHVLHAWTRHRGFSVRDPHAGADLEEDLCAIIFNAQAYLHQTVKMRLERGIRPLDMTMEPTRSADRYPIAAGIRTLDPSVLDHIPVIDGDNPV